MSKWTIYQLLTAFLIGASIAFMNTPPKWVDTIFQFIDEKIVPEAVFLIFVSVVIGVWLIGFLFYCEEKKGKELFVGKIWRIMPVIVSVSLVLTFFMFLTLGLTILTDITIDNRWILHSMIIVFLLQLYLLTLSIYVRYNVQKTNRGKVISSANATVIILLIILFFIPNF